MVLRAREDVVVPEFLPFFLQSETFYERAMAISVGSLSPTINWKALARQEFALPPKDEQRRIAEILRAAEEAINGFRALIAGASLARRTLMADLLQYGVSSNGQIRNPSLEPTSFKQSDFGEIPVGWQICKLRDICTLCSGATPLRSEQERYFNGGAIPWVKTLDLNEGKILDTQEKITDHALEESSCQLMQPGTVLVAMYGGWNQIGRTGILGVEAATNQAICSLVPGSQTLPLFILYALQSGRHRWRRVAASSRKDPNITQADVGDFAIPLPGTIEEQQRICDRIGELEQPLA